MWLFYEGQLTKHRLFGLRTNSVFHACFASCLLMKREKWEIYRWSIQEIKAFVFNVSRSLSLSVFFIFIFISLSLSLPPNCLLMSLTLKSFPGMINVLLGLTRSFFFKGKYKERKSEWTWNLYLPVDFISRSVSLSSPDVPESTHSVLQLHFTYISEAESTRIRLMSSSAAGIFDTLSLVCPSVCRRENLWSNLPAAQTRLRARI